MKSENNCDHKNRSRSRNKTYQRYNQHNQVQNFIQMNNQKDGNDQIIDNKEFILHNSNQIKLQKELHKSNEQNNYIQQLYRDNKIQFMISDQIQCINLESNNQSLIQCENQEQQEKEFLSMSIPQQEKEIRLNETFNKQPFEMITINDSSEEYNQNFQNIQSKGGLYYKNQQFYNQRIGSSRNGIFKRKLKPDQRLLINTSSQQLKQQKQTFECIDLTNDDYIQSFFGLNHPMLQSSMNYAKKELFELVEPYEYQCGNFMIDLGINGYYTAIVTLPNLYLQKSIFYLFMMFQFDQKNIYCMVPEDDQTTLLVSSNIQSLYYYCNSNNKLKKNNQTIQMESTLKYKFPFIYPALIRKFIVSYKKNDSQILYQINYDQHATQLAIEDYYWDNPGHLIIGTSHPILKMLFLKSSNNQIPQYYYKFISVPLYEGQFSLMVSLKQNGNLIVIERRFLSPFCYGINSIIIEFNRLTNIIVMKQIGYDNEKIYSKTIQKFWNEVLSKYLQLYNSKQLYNYFVELINQDRKISEQYKKWNQLYEYMRKSNQLKTNKSNDRTIILNDKQFFCYSIEEIKNCNKNKYQ